MKILDADCEKELKKILDFVDKSNQTKITLNGKDFNETIIQYLVECDFIKQIQNMSTFTNYIILAELTRTGQNYFVDKEKYIKQKRKEKVIDWFKFLFPIAISIAALIISTVK